MSSRKPIKSILLVEDNSGDARLLRENFKDQQLDDIALMHVQCMAEAEEYLASHAVDVILLDLGLPDAQGLGAVRRTHVAAPGTPLVILTGLDDEVLAAQSLQEGAQDYLIKSEIDSYGTKRGLMRALRYAVGRKLLEEALFEEKERAQVTLDSIADAVISTDISGGVTFLNRVAEKITGWSLQEAAGLPMADVFHVMGATSNETISIPAGIVGTGENSGASILFNRILIRRDGLKIPIEDSIAPIHDREGTSIGAVVVFRDVSVARAMALQMVHLAQHDFLTGLPNRMSMHDRINQAIAMARRHEKKVAVLFLDLDGFKHINDSLGHPMGDKLLKSAATRLVDCVRESDTVGRQGGDEFIVLLSEIEKTEDAAISARRMLQAVAEIHSIELRDLQVTTSIGVSIYPDDGLDAESLIKNADIAMYQVKENGRQGYRFFESGMNVRALERQFLEEGLRRALERQELTLHYQPKIDLRTGAVNGAEALLRWTHPVRGPISPAQFIPVAEDCGLMLSIGAWVLRKACEQTQAWIDAGLPAMTIAVNVSALEFREESYLENLFATLTETGLDPGCLELELTESVLMKHPATTASILQTLRKRKIKVAVDDFGTGYSSLSYLRTFALDVLKIDQSFVRQISTAGDDSTIVAAVIAMARSLKLRVVAEGVETLEELTFLRDHQCDEAQGYYFSRPVPPREFAQLLKEGLLKPPTVRRPLAMIN